MFDGLHLTLEARHFGRVALVSTNEEQGRPEQYDADGSHGYVFACLLLLGTSSHRSCLTYTRSLLAQLIASQILIKNRLHIRWCNIFRARRTTSDEERQNKCRDANIHKDPHALLASRP